MHHVTAPANKECDMGEIPSKWQRGVDLAPYTTLRVGGQAEYFVEVDEPHELVDVLRIARTASLPITVLGGGSNVVISDRGLRGLVLRYTRKEIIPLDKSRVRAHAGTHWDTLVEWSTRRGLSGIEGLSGIPGCVGAAPIQNIGAYGAEVSNTIQSVSVIERSSGRSLEIAANDCSFGYRNSIFKGPAAGRFIVVAVTFKMDPGGVGEIRYRDLQQHFGSDTAPVQKIREAVLQIRATKSMLLDEADPNHRSAGSFFVNPVVSPSVADQVDRQAGEKVPRFPTGSHQLKLPAAWLIERSGFHKGYTNGPVGLSTAHALALINRGGARSEDVAALAQLIQNRVRDKFRIELKPEPQWLGFEPE